ncbi:MAG: DNA polymerase III subunit delta' [Candidatus Brocadiia bacterium]
MSWSSVLGHEELAARFREALARGRQAHAYLFAGPEGIGKALFARELAKALQCEAGGPEPCDACRACRKVEHGNHPDVAFIRRVDEGDTGHSRSQILVDQVRQEIQEPIAYKPFEGRHKVFVVADAERMTQEAQNCLLKTLEEPPPHSLLILTAARLEPFVDTVVSRCRVVRFRPLPLQTVERILVERADVDLADARVLGRLSGGSPGRALRYREEGACETVLWLLRELASLAPAGEFALAGDLLDAVREQGAPLEAARQRLRLVLDLLTLAWRDVLFRRCGYARELLAWEPEPEELAAAGGGLSAEQARHMVDACLEARDQVDANANIKLLLEKLLLDTRARLEGREPVVTR